MGAHDGYTYEYRLVIEGLPYEAVTSEAMESLRVDGRRRVAGLLREGMSIEETCDPARATTESAGFIAKIVDDQHDERWTSVLTRRPALSDWLVADVDESSTTIFVNHADLLETQVGAGGIIHVGTEAMRLVDFPAAGEVEVERGVWDTIPQAHYTSDGADLSWPEVTVELPASLEGRRADLYRYNLEAGQNLQGNGTLIWRGVCQTDAAEDSGVYSVRIGSLFDLIRQPLGSDLDQPCSVRGIFFPDVLTYTVTVGERENVRSEPTLARSGAFQMAGFWETEEAFCAAFQIAIRAVMAGAAAGTAIDLSSTTSISSASVTRQWTSAANVDLNTVFVQPNEGRWQCTFIVPSASTRWLLWLDTRAGEVEIDGDILIDNRTYTDGEVAELRPTLGGVPRGMWGLGGGSGRGASREELSVWRLYLDRSVVGVEGASVRWQDGGEPDHAGRFLAADTATNSIEMRPGHPSAFTVRAYYPETRPEITIRRRYGDGSLADFRDWLVTNSPSLANRGGAPLITSRDLADWQAAVTRAAEGRGYVLGRRYESSGQIDLDKMLAEECKLLGVFPVLDANARISLARLELPSASAVAAFDIALDETVLSTNPPTFERNAFGSWNSITIKTGYNIDEDEHRGRTWEVPDVTARSRARLPRKLEIAPKSLDPFPPTLEDAVSIARRPLGVFGRPYSVVTVDVTPDLFEVARCGEVARFTSPKIPNPELGRRGMTAIPALVIGRSWDLETGVGTLTLMVSDNPIFGYAPSVWVYTHTPGSGNEWDLDVLASFPNGSSGNLMPPGSKLSDFYAPGDELVHYEFDSDSPFEEPCTVLEVGDDPVNDGEGFLRVDAPSGLTVPTPPAAAMLRSAPWTLASELQRRFAFYADADGALTPEPVRKYSA